MRPTLGFAEPAPMIYVEEPVRWEYKQIIRDTLDGEQAPTEEELDQLGQEGWELTGAFSLFAQMFLYFKRSIRE
jgi:hypothetical protein